MLNSIYLDISVLSSCWAHTSHVSVVIKDTHGSNAFMLQCKCMRL